MGRDDLCHLGGLHGLFLVVNQLWQMARQRLSGHDLSRSSYLTHFLSVVITFVCVVVAWVFFRATNLDTALNVLNGMIGLNGVVLPFHGSNCLDLTICN